mmetsp:Transcript_12399/g.32060  ORF Transcript_12399/g.32060 Transcript_12399/m.32060 type:complete len:267 (+) Transcript_12399:489-1289(+)
MACASLPSQSVRSRKMSWLSQPMQSFLESPPSTFPDMLASSLTITHASGVLPGRATRSLGTFRWRRRLPRQPVRRTLQQESRCHLQRRSVRLPGTLVHFSSGADARRFPQGQFTSRIMPRAGSCLASRQAHARKTLAFVLPRSSWGTACWKRRLRKRFVMPTLLQVGRCLWWARGKGQERGPVALPSTVVLTFRRVTESGVPVGPEATSTLGISRWSRRLLKQLATRTAPLGTQLRRRVPRRSRLPGGQESSRPCTRRVQPKLHQN